MIQQHVANYQSDIGQIRIVGTEAGLLSLEFIEDVQKVNKIVHPCLKECLNQLDEYFCGKRKNFSVRVQMNGTDFQRRVWNRMLDIPFGATQTYSQIADVIGLKKAFRAVGSACGKNRLAIIVPCHRVVGASGNLTGYAYGIFRKKWLLDHENR